MAQMKTTTRAEFPFPGLLTKQLSLVSFKPIYCSLLAIFLVNSTHSFAQNAEPNSGKPAYEPTSLFNSDAVLNVTIHAPWRKLTRNKKNQDAYPATLEWTDGAGQTHSTSLTVGRRGKSRQEVCSFPPIKLKLDKSSDKGETFAGQKSLKMVTHCDTGNRYEQYYIKEMLAYRMYNAITDFSFRVRQISVTYADNDTGSVSGAQFAFLIEDEKDMARRNGQEMLTMLDTTSDRLEPLETTYYALFQYMISNLDWSVLSGHGSDDCCHNGKIIGLDPKSDPMYVIPYDFDMSGLVNAHYAMVPEGLRVRSVRQRLYRGFCAHDEYLDEALKQFKDEKATILGLIENEPLLNKNTRRATLSYIGQFFKMLSDTDKFKAGLIKRCRG